MQSIEKSPDHNIPFKASRAFHEQRVTASYAGRRLDVWLKHHRPDLPYGLIQKLLRKRRIHVDGRRAGRDQLLQEGQTISVLADLKEGEKNIPKAPPKTATLRSCDQKWLSILENAILYEDDHLLVIDKPLGLAVQGGTNTPTSLDRLVRSLPFPYAAELRLTHRLDKDTTGVLILAKSLRDASWVTQAFKENQIEKTYWGFVCGVPSPLNGLIDLPVGKRSGQDGEKMRVDPILGRRAITSYAVKGQGKGMAWVEFYPQTGRTHQIRVHSAAQGFPLIGDGKYGGQAAHPFDRRTRLCLHAYRVRLSYPEGGDVKTFEAPLPKDMVDVAHLFLEEDGGDGKGHLFLEKDGPS